MSYSVRHFQNNFVSAKLIIGENYDKLSSNHRMSFPVRHWDKMPKAQKNEITEHAVHLLNNLDTL